MCFPSIVTFVAVVNGLSFFIIFAGCLFCVYGNGIDFVHFSHSLRLLELLGL